MFFDVYVIVAAKKKASIIWACLYVRMLFVNETTEKFDDCWMVDNG